VCDGTFNAGDYVYEPSEMLLHDATTALEDTTYLFIRAGLVLFFDENGFRPLHQLGNDGAAALGRKAVAGGGIAPPAVAVYLDAKFVLVLATQSLWTRSAL